MTQHDDSEIAAWLTAGPHHGPAPVLDAALAQARTTGQRPAWLVSLTGGTVAEQPRNVLTRYAVYALVALALSGLLLGGMVAGGVIRPPSFPNIFSLDSTPPPPTTPSTTPSPGLVAYTVASCHPRENAPSGASPVCTSTGWLATSDGRGARQLPGTPLGWSADGSRLLLKSASGLLLTDEGGATLATYPDTCATKGGSCTAGETALCQFPCTMADGYALSPDGTRVAFVRGYANDGNATVIAILDLASGRITELASTRTTNPPTQERCYAVTTCQGDDGDPRWSPDGRLLVFDRQTMSPDSPSAAWTSGALFVVEADGANLRRLTPIGLDAFDPQWSSDGTRLAFTNIEFVVNADRTRVLAMHADVYTIGLDGSGLARLTTDGSSAIPDWTADGRLSFMRTTGPVAPGGPATQFEHWVMDVDGANQHRGGDSLAELTSAGCRTCFYVADTAYGQVPLAYWQPHSGGH